MKISEFTTKQLHEELMQRTGVTEISISHDNKVTISDKIGILKTVEGPARILVNID